MRSVIAFVAVALSVVATAQELPQCAAEAVGDNFAGCSAVDIGCICANDKLLSDLACKVTKSCSQEEIDTLLTFARNLCEPQGVTLPETVDCPVDEASNAASDDESSGDGASDAASDDQPPAAETGAAAQLGMTGASFGAVFAGLLAIL